MATDEYAKIFKRSWGDRDFKALTLAQQALYHKLISQPDISLAGVLTLAVQRWAEQTADLTVEAVEDTLANLETARFVVVDRSTQEVLIRSYIRRDLGWRSPRTMKGISGAVDRVLSPMLRATISGELLRIDTSGLSSTVSEKTGRSTRDVVDEELHRIISDDPPIRSDSAQHTPSDTPCNTPSEGVSNRVSAIRARNYNGNGSSNGKGSSNGNGSSSSAMITSAPKPSSVTREEPVDNFSTGGPDSEPHDFGFGDEIR